MSHFKGADISNFLPNTSIIKLLEEALRKNGDATAMIEGQTGKTATFKDILQQATSIAAGLRSAGVTAGDYVVICGDKSIIAYSVLVGVMFTGATAVMFPIPHADIMDKLTKGFHIKAVFCDRGLLHSLKKSTNAMNPQPLIFGAMDDNDETMGLLLRSSFEYFKIFEVKDAKTHVPLIFFSSGTTGDPKGIQLKDAFVQLCGTYFDTKCKVFLTASPIYWLTGILFFISSTFYNYKLVLSNSTNAKDNLQLLESYKVDGWFTGTGSLSRYFNEPTLHQFNIGHLQIVFTGGECVLGSSAKNFVSKVLKDKTNLCVMYGSTEAGMLSTGEICPKSGHFETGVCGKHLSGVEMKIVNDDGNIVEKGELGEICAKSVAMTPGYWGRPDLTELAFDQDGFFRTGDAGFFDEDGNLYVRGRVGDLINFKGTKVSPVEVEDVLMSHEAVLDAAVVGKPHPVDNQHLTAFVVRVPGIQVSEQQLENFVNNKIEDRMQLKGGVNFLDVLPRTVIGKIQRKRLREISENL